MSVLPTWRLLQFHWKVDCKQKLYLLAWFVKKIYPPKYPPAAHNPSQKTISHWISTLHIYINQQHLELISYVGNAFFISFSSEQN